MAKNRKSKRREDDAREPFLREETKNGVAAVICLALGLFFSLASLHYAGWAGDRIFDLLTGLIGLGFYLIPVICFLFSWSLTRAVKFNFLGRRLISGLFFFLISAAVLHIVLADREPARAGGLLGRLIASPLQKLFDVYGLILLLALGLISLLVMFDRELKIIPSTLQGWLTRLWRKEQALGPARPLALELSEQEQQKLGENETATSDEESPPADHPAADGNDAAEAAKERAGGEAGGGLGRLINWGKIKSLQKFNPPPLSLIETDRGKPAPGDIKANANIIKRTLGNFGIVVEMDEVSIGPSITRYALKPAEGVKLSRIVALQNDLALALAAHPIRIEAPIPGRSLVGIEVPNNVKSIVGLGSLLGSKEFKDSPPPLLVALGRDITGRPHFADLARAPHLLIAGATGSGKSVSIHALIVSLLYRNSPDMLRFLMVDPKRVELTVYNTIPHLLTPVVTEPKKAILVLQWAIKEMERRYEILEKESVRDIHSYHLNVLKTLGPGKNHDGKEGDEGPEKMPYIVIIIDELADIMSVYPRELEASVVRLAQMSRAVGIHLVLSTQRPSVEIITGLIKANIPSRVALQVTSQIDSRTILDMGGAEKLLGAGDLLYISAQMSKPVRLQSAFISENEVKNVVKFLRKEYRGTDPAADEIQNLVLGNAGPGNEGQLDFTEDWSGDEEDPLLEEARRLVVEAQKASASYLQRKLKIGYARAARLLDLLEERGIIGPAAGAKHREVYQGRENYDPAESH